jgi:glycolate oxidase FAD binding subunit
VIVEATFKVRPGPADEEAVVISCPTIAAAARAARAVLDGDAPPFWLEIGAAADLAAGPGDGVAVAVGLAGRAEEIAFGRERVLAAAAALGLDAVAVEGGAALRTRLAGFAAEPAAAVLRLATLPADVGRVMEAVEAAGAHLRCLASAANGVVRVAVPEAGAAVALVRALRPEAEARGGSLVVERAVPAVKAELDVWGDPGAGLPLMRRLKAAFDPGGLFAPGRFVGGI